MSTTRIIYTDLPEVRDKIQLGDVLVFRNKDGVAPKGQVFVSDDLLDEKFVGNTHAAIVVGKTANGVPIITHMLAKGNKTERLDCSPYAAEEFIIHSAKNSILRQEIAAKCDLQPEVTNILAQTTARAVKDNSAYVQALLKDNNLIGRNGDIYTHDSGKVSYSIFKVLQAGALSILGLSSEKESRVASPVQSQTVDIKKIPKFNISASSLDGGKENNNIQLSDSEMCISLVVKAIQESERKYEQDIASYVANKSRLSFLANQAGWSKEVQQWYNETHAAQVEELNLTGRHTNIMPGILSTLLENANTLFNTSWSKDFLPRDERTVKFVTIGDEKWIWQSDKIGGANVGRDEYTGIYARYDNSGKIIERALIKQDWQGDVVRVAKVLGEGLAGNMLANIYTQVMGLPEDSFAKVKFGRAEGVGIDETGRDTYVVSVYIRGYQDDLWKYAYREELKADIRDESATKLLLNPTFVIESEPDDTLTDYIQKHLETLLDKHEALMREMVQAQSVKDIIRVNPETNQLERVKVENTYDFAGAQAKLADIAQEMDLNVAKLQLLNQRENENFVERTPANEHLIESLITDLANIELEGKKRPSAAFFAPGSTEARKVVSDFIVEFGLIEEFAKLAAPRILLGDFGLHNANFGVRHDEQGKPHLVALDYGAAFLNLIENLNPYDIHKTGIGGMDKYYKNHFLEYSSDIITSVEMANAYIQLGDMTQEQLDDFILQGLNDVQSVYGAQAIEEFKQRVGWDKIEHEYGSLYEFLAEQLNDRNSALREIGYGILLEHLYSANNADMKSNLREAFELHPGLEDYLYDKFLEEPCLVHKDISIKHEIVAAALDVMAKMEIETAPLDEVIKESIAELQIDFDQQLADTALRNAVTIESLDTVCELLGMGANIYALNKYGESAQELAQKFQDPLVLSLVEAQHEAIQQLMQAAKNGDIDKLKDLLEDGININVVDESGNTALHLAMQFGQLEIGNYLVDQGIETDVLNQEGLTAEDLLSAFNVEPVQDYLLLTAVTDGSLADVKELIAMGEDVNQYELITHDNALLLAARDGKWDVVTELLKSPDIDVEHSNSSNENILQMAVQANQADIVKNILAKTPGLSPEQVNCALQSTSKNAGDIVIEVFKFGALDTLKGDELKKKQVAGRQSFGMFGPADKKGPQQEIDVGLTPKGSK